MTPDARPNRSPGNRGSLHERDVGPLDTSAAAVAFYRRRPELVRPVLRFDVTPNSEQCPPGTRSHERINDGHGRRSAERTDGSSGGARSAVRGTDPVSRLRTVVASSGTVPGGEGLQLPLGRRRVCVAERIRKRKRPSFYPFADMFGSVPIPAAAHPRSELEPRRCRFEVVSVTDRSRRASDRRDPSNFPENDTARCVVLSERAERAEIRSSRDRRRRTADGARRPPGSPSRRTRE